MNLFLGSVLYNFSQKYKISFSWALNSVHRFSRQSLKGKEMDEKEPRRRLLKWSKNQSIFNLIRLDDDMIVPPSDGLMIIWIDWE